MTRMHFTAPYLLSPYNPITINLIGAGGTGCHVLSALAKIDHALVTLEHPGLFVRLWDDDVITEANLGRQLFARSELHQYKAEAAINRINRFYGLYWQAITGRFDEAGIKAAGSNAANVNITITCVDSVKSRFVVHEALSKQSSNIGQGPTTQYYWLDFGNSRQTGQVVLSSVGKIKQPSSKQWETVTELPSLIAEYGDVLQQSETDDDTPSCSLAEALTKQDLFINPMLADMGCKLLWSMLREGMTTTRGLFLNLADFRSQPLKV